MNALQAILTVEGSIDPTLFLPPNIAGLAGACAHTKRMANPAPGFILSTGCFVPRDAALEAFWVFARPCAAPG